MVLEDWRRGKVTSFKRLTGQHHVQYMNGHSEWVHLGEGDESQEARLWLNGSHCDDLAAPTEVGTAVSASRLALHWPSWRLCEDPLSSV